MCVIVLHGSDDDREQSDTRDENERLLVCVCVKGEDS